MELPENPTREMLRILAGIGPGGRVYLEDMMALARSEQHRLGLEVVPPNFEMEEAAAKYRLLYEHIKRTNERKEAK